MESTVAFGSQNQFDNGFFLKVVGDIRRCLKLQTFPPTDRLAACSLITYRDSLSMRLMFTCLCPCGSTAFYGSELWHLRNRKLLDFGRMWNKSIRRIWK